MTVPVTRRQLLRTLGVTAGAAALGPRIVAAEPVEDRFIVNTNAVDPRRLRGDADVTVVHDMSDEIGFAVCRAPGRRMRQMAPEGSYAHDLRIERGVPQQATGPTAEETAGTESTGAPALYDLQWDKIEQDVLSVHGDGATGAGARIGVIDDGVLGASEQFSASHPDLPNVNKSLSTSFVPRPEDGGDNFGAGPLTDDHGTHVAGTAAAAGETGVVGVAPEAEIVDIRVFSGTSATFGDVVRAVVYGAHEANCDVLNLSLGSGPLLPVEGDPADADDPDGPGPIFPVNADDLAVLVAFIDKAGEFAVANGALPVAAAGNDGVDLDRTFENAFSGSVDVEDEDGDVIATVDFDGSPVSLPNEGTGFLSVAAAGPIGYGWPGAGDSVAGLPFEADVDPELRTEEPAFFTNYGRDAVDVSAGGGNADIDAIGSGVQWFYDLVLSTTFDIPSDDIPEGTQLGNNYTPSYGWKAGTSFAAPNVSGLAALLAAADPSAGPDDLRQRIESSAVQIDVGLLADEKSDEPNGETTAPAQDVSVPGVLASGNNVAHDGTFDGDDASAPDTVDLDDSKYDSEAFRGEGHIDVAGALEEN